ncbi:DUF3806 domain-containing protein [Duganella sp. Leaf126]|uniref:DUF3806 domain-containing protein n=1 Tax=Duganella sp. Leaf126 TaxID=1736266 RepID=UPI0009E6FD03|nr:DUF3806 domain-containing protein [Duganella sp. Leaf126]
MSTNAVNLHVNGCLTWSPPTRQSPALRQGGVVWGEAFALGIDYHWIVVDDAHGRDYAPRYKDTSVIIFPPTMISKCVEHGEEVEVFDLYNGGADTVQEILRKNSDTL